ncbi:protein kinase [Novymonas esmeraldas]|uniref:Protein kinase n=1 Tax=Novymonas esmeraldas TaxID=1808958 RepID=A0AAW0EMA7_9TRYP
MEAVVKLNRKLGVGSRGVVYEGFDHARGHFVAIKELAYMEPSIADEEDTELEAILRELAYMREAQHPNLVQYYGARRSAIGIQIIMEYVSGGSLDYVLTRCGPVRETVARAYVRDVLEALHYLHTTMHVCHRDVKPANILITPDGRCKLADFGVAKHVGATTPTHHAPADSHRSAEAANESPAAASRHSRGGRRGYLQTAVGTPWYMAPEVINGGVEEEEDEEEEEDAEDASDGGDDEDDVGGGGSRCSCSDDWTTGGLPHTPPRQPLYSSSSYYNPLKHIVKRGRLGARSVGYTTSADIWSVGVTVFEMIAGTKPFGADLSNPSAVLFRIANCAASPPRLPADVHVSAELQNFLELCFVYDKDLRATAAELLGHPWLRQACRGGSAARSAAEAPLPAAPAPAQPLATAGHGHERRSVRAGERKRESQSEPTPVARRTVFDGVQLLDAIDLPAYPAHTAASSPASSAVADGDARGDGGPRAPTTTTTSPGRAHQRQSQPPSQALHRLSCSGIHPGGGGSVPRSSASGGTPLPSPVSVTEQAEASSRYAAARLRIGHTRTPSATTAATATAAATAATAATATHSGSGGFWTSRGEFIDLLSHP